ncbi:MAG: 4-hydroxy-3-methylbut-2-enyl diphosphate reductase [Clostridiales bacterium]|nr:4-hydroxy-3-methylbut-2-enyl diphosphate reductase [Candidatus Blautia equi]
MEVKVAKTAGFCFGVKRAVDKVYELIDSGIKPIYTFGPIIHNEQVVADLEQHGVFAITEEQLDDLKEGTVVLRSHGVEKRIYDKLEALGIHYVDVTCPFVLKIHRIVEEKGKQGAHVVILGDPDHPEVKGICGWCTGPYTVIRDTEDAEAFVPDVKKPLSVVSQTTFNFNKFKDIVEILRNKMYNESVLEYFDVLHTICNATEERQKEAREIAGAVDTMLVIGGRNSSNTQKLFDICRHECDNTYYIQSPVNLVPDMFQCSSYVGITAGASTPKKIIEEVQEHVRIKF